MGNLFLSRHRICSLCSLLLFSQHCSDCHAANMHGQHMREGPFPHSEGTKLQKAKPCTSDSIHNGHERDVYTLFLVNNACKELPLLQAPLIVPCCTGLSCSRFKTQTPPRLRLPPQSNPQLSLAATPLQTALHLRLYHPEAAHRQIHH